MALSYEVLQSPSFLHDLVSVEPRAQKAVPTMVKKIGSDPYRAGGYAGKCLKQYYRNVYRVRVGDYRLIYAVGRACVRLLALGHRRDIYQRLSSGHLETGGLDDSQGSARPRPVNTLPGQEPPESLPEGEPEPADADPGARAPEGTPGELLRGLLEKWGVPRAYRGDILACRSPQEIHALEVPDDIKARVLHWHFPGDMSRLEEEPNFRLEDPDDLERYAEGRLKRFLLRLDPEQERAASRHLSGPALVKGGPGTGKSLVALYRVRNLAEKSSDQNSSPSGSTEGRILFVTYTRSLVQASRELLREILPENPSHVTVTNLDRLVREIITGAGENFAPAPPKVRRQALEEVLAAGGDGLLPLVPEKMGPDYLLDEFSWVIEGRGVQTLEDYLSEDRSGREIRLGRGLRSRLWKLHQAYLERLRDQGLDTWDRYRNRARQILSDGGSGPRFDHVVVDEAQDLTPVGLGLCVEMAKTPAGVYLTADTGQSIYGRGYSWRQIHRELDLRGRTTVLRYNYRSTGQIQALARDFLGQPPDPETARSVAMRRGPQPRLVACGNLEEQAYAAGLILEEEQRRLRLPPGACAVLVRRNHLAEKAAALLADLGLQARRVTGAEFDLSDRDTKVMTMHSAKGLEFPVVVVMGLDEGVIPQMEAVITPEEGRERLSDERRLLYVALTRAMRSLAITYTRDKPSPLVTDLGEGLVEAVEAGDLASRR